MDNNQKPEDSFFNYDPSYGYTKNAKRGAADNFWGEILYEIPVMSLTWSRYVSTSVISQWDSITQWNKSVPSP